MKRKKLEKRLVVGYADGSRCDWAAVDIAFDSSLKESQVAALLSADWRLDVSHIPQDLPVYSGENAVWRAIASLLDHQEPGPNLRVLSEMLLGPDLKVVCKAIDRARGGASPRNDGLRMILMERE